METNAKLGAILLAGAMTAAGADAEIQVVPDAAWQGRFGLRADVVEACAGEVSILFLGDVVTPQRVEACKEVVVGPAEVRDGGELEVVAGHRVSLGDGFRVGEGGRLAAAATGAWETPYLLEERPTGESDLHVRWYTRLDAVGLPPGGRVSLLGLEDGARERARIRYEVADGGGWSWVEVLDDVGTRHTSSRTWLGEGWHRLELGWSAGGVLEPQGRVVLLVDGAEAASLDALELGQGLVETVRLGAWSPSGEGGWVDIDEVAAGRTGPLGPAP